MKNYVKGRTSSDVYNSERAPQIWSTCTTAEVELDSRVFAMILLTVYMVLRECYTYF